MYCVTVFILAGILCSFPGSASSLPCCTNGTSFPDNIRDPLVDALLHLLSRHSWSSWWSQFSWKSLKTWWPWSCAEIPEYDCTLENTAHAYLTTVAESEDVLSDPNVMEAKYSEK
ncbi:hypothetical protein NECAME_08844 [Necator americanus]|uniref:Uncharacterized protein n=1 Tax=Necator americanus TaxID=51031 RepID=W2TFY3_NECAM|nr:hypothetical protein NECAME_08844 [Necator americanus]ETN80950.1 hypothetical protein NECAME_08844 [Necator americanus]